MKLLLNTTTASEADICPEHFVVEVTESMKNRILRLGKAVKELNASSVTEFNYSGGYFHSDFLETLESEGIDFEDIDEALVEERAYTRMDVNQLIVFEDSFQFSAVPKHCGMTEETFTDLVSFEQLTNDDDVFALEY